MIARVTLFAIAVATAATMVTLGDARATSVGLAGPNYSGLFLVTVDGFVCDINCSVQSAATSQSISGPDSLSYSGSAPLISTGYHGYIVPGNYPKAATAYGSFSFSQNPSPGMTMFGTASALDVAGASAGVQIGNANMTYSMEILGPTATVGVAVNARGGVSVSSLAAGGGSNDMAQVYFGVNGEFADNLTLYPVNGSNSKTFDDTSTYTLFTNQIYTVELYGVLQASVNGNFGGGTETFSGYIDPTFTVIGKDPGAYTLTFSPGIGNMAAAPELSTWAMLMLGLASIGIMACRQRSKPVLMAA